MILFEKNDKLKVAFRTSLVHLERMRFAYSKIQHFFPLSVEKYGSITEDEFSYFDQFIYRFTKLQDFVGSKLFTSILVNLGEEVQGIPFIDIVQSLEKLQVIPSADEWFLLREIRNELAHEYPDNTEQTIDDLNILNNHYKSLLETWEKIASYIQKRFGYLLTD